MNTSHNHLREPGLQESSFVRAKGYLSDLSKPEKEILLENLGVGSGKILVENFPDEEDLTQKIQGSRNVLKFKDKIFNPAVCSGMGKVYLRKNLIKDIHHCKKNMNILTQKMFEDEHGLPLVNTIFIVQYDYDLDKGFITIPDNSILVFAGGSFTNGTVMLRNTLILPAGLDVERFMAVNIRGTYKEGSLVYLRKRLRLFNGETWVSLGGPGDFGPRDTCELINLLKSYINAALDIVSPFKITLTPEKNYIEKGEHDIKVSWNYNRLITNQDIRLESGTKYSIYKELDKKVREYTFEGIDTEEPVTIVISTTYKGETVSEAITLDFNQNPGLIIDDELDEESTNPVTNRAITRAIRSLEVSIQTGLADLLALIRQEFLTKIDAENIYLKKEDFDLSDIYDALDRKVDKEAGKGLSSNDFTNVLKNKLEGINLDNYALKNHTHSNYANVNHTHSEYALVNHTHVISDIAGLEEALNRAGVTYTLSKNGNNIILTGSDGSTSTVAISGIDENALKTLIQAKLRLVHGTGNISLIYDGTNLATVPDEKGSSEGGITEDEVKELIKENLDVTHVGDLIKLKYGNTIFGNGTTDMTGEGGGDDDGLPGNILIYFLKTSTSNVPETPVDGQIADPTSPSGTWLDYAPNHETGKYIWMSQIYQTHSRNNYGNWTTPILIDDGQEGGSAGSDTSGIKFIYAVSNIEDFKLTQIHHPETDEPVQRDNYVPNQWSDTAIGIDENHRYEFISHRVKTDGIWGRFSVPVLWSVYGRDGIDGNGVEYIFFKGSVPPQDNDIENPHKWYTDVDSKADVNKTSFNRDEYILENSGWTDDPESLEAGDSVWVSIRKYRNDSGSGSAEETDAYWHQYSEPALWSHYGKDAVSAGALDFDNQTMTVPVNNETGRNYLFSDVAYAYIFYSQGNASITSLTYDGIYNGDDPISGNPVRVQISGNKVIVTISEGELDFSQIKNYSLKFTAQAEGIDGDRTGTIKLIGVQSGKDGESYKLFLNTSVVKKQVGTQTGLYIPDSITPKLIITGGENEGVYTPTEIAGSGQLSQRFEIKYSFDGSLLRTLSSDSIEITQTIENFIVVALTYNGDIIDQETIFIIKDGHDGIPGTIYNISPIYSDITYDNSGDTTEGTVKFKFSRKVGSNSIEYRTEGGEAWCDLPVVSLEKSNGNSGQYDTLNLVGDTYTAIFGKQGEFDCIKITMRVSNTDVVSIIVPVMKDKSEGTQTLEYSVLRIRSDVDCNSSEEKDFYCGRNYTDPIDNVKYLDAVRWNGKVDGKSPNDTWGTYLCIKDCRIAPNEIPSSNFFTKLDYSFGEVFSYLIADRALIDSLSIRQVALLDNSDHVVGGMTSGEILPADAKNLHNNHDIRIWAGSLDSTGDINSAAFTVDSVGHVKANNITINGTGSFTGTVTATSGSFKGEVQATSFEVMSNNEVQMYLTTWGELKNDVQILNVDLSSLDETTAGSLTDNTPVIAMKQGSSYYLLTPLLLRQSSGRKAETYYTFSKQMILGSEDYYRVKEGEYKTLYYDSNDKLYYTQLSGGSPFNDNNMNYYKKTDSTNVILKGTVNSIISDIDKYECYTFTSGTRNTGSPILIGDVWMITPAATGSGSSISTLNGLKIDYIPDSEEDITGREETFNNETFTPGTHDNVNPSDPGRINGTVFGISTSSPIKRVIYAKPNRTSSTIEPYSAVSKIEVKSSAANSGWLNNSI